MRDPNICRSRSQNCIYGVSWHSHSGSNLEPIEQIGEPDTRRTILTRRMRSTSRLLSGIQNLLKQSRIWVNLYPELGMQKTVLRVASRVRMQDAVPNFNSSLDKSEKNASSPVSSLERYGREDSHRCCASLIVCARLDVSRVRWRHAVPWARRSESLCQVSLRIGQNCECFVFTMQRSPQQRSHKFELQFS